MTPSQQMRIAGTNFQINMGGHEAICETLRHLRHFSLGTETELSQGQRLFVGSALLGASELATEAPKTRRPAECVLRCRAFMAVGPVGLQTHTDPMACDDIVDGSSSGL